MSELRFAWDPRKAAQNLRKHGVSFSEAETVFSDERALLIDDPDHSEEEDRFLLLGLSSGASVARRLPQLPEQRHGHSAHLGLESDSDGTSAIHPQVSLMRKSYDFSKGRPNPYAKLLKRPVTIRLDTATIDYFKQLARAEDIPYQTLINLYLRDCAAHQRRLDLTWRARRPGAA
jgi:uncharacterized protein (DUF4415 family)